MMEVTSTGRGLKLDVNHTQRTVSCWYKLALYNLVCMSDI